MFLLLSLFPLFWTIPFVFLIYYFFKKPLVLGHSSNGISIIGFFVLSVLFRSIYGVHKGDN